MPRRSLSSTNNSADATTSQIYPNKGNKAKKRKLDFIEACDGWTKPKRVKNASLIGENDFVLEPERWYQGTETCIHCLFYCLSPAKEEGRHLQPQEVRRVEELRRKLNATMTIGEFTKVIPDKLLQWAEEQMPANKRICPAVNVNAANTVNQSENVLDWVFARKKVREMREIACTESSNKEKLFNDDNDGFKAMRLEKRLGHVPVCTKSNSQKYCAMCNKSKKWTECWICGVMLCCYGDEAETGCFKDFHVDQQLN
jgi:hypothetical protein